MANQKIGTTIGGHLAWHSGNMEQFIKVANALKIFEKFEGKMIIKSTGSIGASNDHSKAYLQITNGTEKMSIDTNQIVSNADLWVGVDDTSKSINTRVGTTDRFKVRAAFASTYGNLIVGAIDTTPRINLAIKDDDTGFKWFADGDFAAMANNQEIVRFHTSACTVKKNLRCDGLVYGEGGVGFDMYSSNEINFKTNATSETSLYFGYRQLGNSKIGDYYFGNGDGNSAGKAKGRLWCGSVFSAGMFHPTFSGNPRLIDLASDNILRLGDTHGATSRIRFHMGDANLGNITVWANNRDYAIVHEGNWGVSDARYLRKSQNTTMIDGDGTHTKLFVKSRSNNGKAELLIYGTGQSDACVFVGQDPNYGGGIEYRGDATLSSGSTMPQSNGTADTVNFFRRSGGNPEWVFKYAHNSNNVYFRAKTIAVEASATGSSGFTACSETWGGTDKTSQMSNANDVSWGVAGGAAFRYRHTNNGSAHWLLGDYKDASHMRAGIQVRNDDGGAMAFYVNGRTKHAGVNSDGSLHENGIKLSDSYAPKRNYFIANSTSPQGYLGVNNPADSSAIALEVKQYFTARDIAVFYAGSASKIRFTRAGDVLAIGNVEGYSDIRLKKNVVVISRAMEKINKLRGITFNWKDEERFDKRRHSSLIAQELQKVLPEAVSERDGELTIDKSAVIPLVIEGMKEQDKEIQTLKKEVEQLKHMVKLLMGDK